MLEMYPNISKEEGKQILKVIKEKNVTIDWNMIDKNLDYPSLIQYLYKDYGLDLTPTETPTETPNKSEMNWEEILPQIKSVAVLGVTGSGKTSLSHKILGKVKMDIYCYNYPKPHLIKKLGWKNLYSIEDINRLNNVCLWIDEPQNYWKLNEHKANEALAKILALARQRGLLLVISTSVSHFITRMLEGQIDVWCIKDVDYDSVKQGSRARKIIKDYCTLDPDGFRLKPNEYLFYCRKFYDRYRGKFEYTLPAYWNENYSKPYK